MLGIPLGFAYSNFLEWVLHRFVLHGLGKNPQSYWSFHWHEHHQKSRRHAMVDDQYQTPLSASTAKSKEVLGLAALALLHTPLLRRFPVFVTTLAFTAVRYYRLHRRAHLDSEWAREHLPWHWEHHMGRDQNANWCVTNPFFDYVMGTRRHFLAPQGASVASRADGPRGAWTAGERGTIARGEGPRAG